MKNSAFGAGSATGSGPLFSRSRMVSMYLTDDQGYRHRVQVERPAPAEPAQRPPPPTPRTAPIIGTGQRHGMRVVAPPPRRCDIYVSRFHPDTTVEEVTRCVVNITKQQPLNIYKLGNRYNNSRFASFRISCEEKFEEILLSGDSWDEGTLVRKFTNRMNND